MIETKSPVTELFSSVETDATFAEIVSRYHSDIPPELVEEADVMVQLNEALSDPDLQAGRIDELRAARDELLEEFLVNPHDSYVAEVINYARLCEKRSLSMTTPDGTTMTEFVTSDHEKGRADLHFQIVTLPSGTTLFRTEVPGRDDKGVPFIITAGTDGSFLLEEKEWHREIRRVPLTLEKGGRGEKLLKQFFLCSTEAVHLAYERSPEARAKFDSQAKRYLLKKLNSGL